MSNGSPTGYGLPPDHYAEAYVRRPKSPMVFGILSIVFSSLALAYIVLVFLPMVVEGMNLAAADELSEEGQEWMATAKLWLTIIGLYVLVGLASGIGLVRYRRWGRHLFCVLALFSFGLLIHDVAGAVSSDAPLESSDISGLIGGVIRQVFPILGLVFLFRPKVAASLK